MGTVVVHEVFTGTQDPTGNTLEFQVEEFVLMFPQYADLARQGEVFCVESNAWDLVETLAIALGHSHNGWPLYHPKTIEKGVNLCTNN